MTPKEESKTCLAERNRRDDINMERQVSVVSVKTACRDQATLSV